MRAENTRKSQELREKKSKLAAIKHFQKMKRVSITDFIDMTSKVSTLHATRISVTNNYLEIAAAEGVIKAMTDTFNEVVKAYKGRMMKQVQDEYLNTVVLADVLRERGEELENDPTTNLVDFLRKEMPMEYGESEEWKNRVKESRKMWHKHLDEFPLD